MRNLLLRVGAVAVTGLALAISARACRSDGEARLRAAQARATEACRVFRAQPGQTDAEVCRYDDFGRSTISLSRAGDASVSSARAALAAGDPRAAERALLTAAARARDLDRHGGFGAIHASHVVEGILSVVDAHHADLEPHALAAILDVELRAAAHPFETWRVHKLWSMSSYLQYRLGDAPDLSPGALATAMETDEAAYVAMDRATTSGDLEACKRAARTTSVISYGHDFNEGLCTTMAKAVATGKRLATVRSAARARAAYLPPLSRSIDAELMQ